PRWKIGPIPAVAASSFTAMSPKSRTAPVRVAARTARGGHRPVPIAATTARGGDCGRLGSALELLADLHPAVLELLLLRDHGPEITIQRSELLGVQRLARGGREVRVKLLLALRELLQLPLQFVHLLLQLALLPGAEGGGHGSRAAGRCAGRGAGRAAGRCAGRGAGRCAGRGAGR